MSSTQATHFNSVADFSTIDRLLAMPEAKAEDGRIVISLPLSEKEAFEAALDTHNENFVKNRDASELLAQLQKAASEHYERAPDGTYVLEHSEESPDKPKFETLQGAVDFAANNGLIPDSNMTGMNLTMLDPETGATAVQKAGNFLDKNGYKDISYIGAGTFVLAFQAQHAESGHTHIVKFSGWGGVDQIKGHDVPDNLKTILDSPEDMPDDWLVYVFPEVLPLENISTLQTGQNYEIHYEAPDGEGEVKSYRTLGDSDLVAEIFVNSMTEGHFPSDTAAGNIALLPGGCVKAYDMGVVAPISSPTLNPFDPERAARQKTRFQSLGASLRHVDDNGVPTDIAAFQPARYQEFLPSGSTPAAKPSSDDPI